MTSQDGDDGPNRRQLARAARRRAGDRSADLARELMQVSDAVLAKLELHEDLADVVSTARGVSSPIARRRAERTLAGALRGEDLAALATRLETVRTTGSAEPELLHLVERWRDRLVADDAAFAELPFSDEDGELRRLVERARSERTQGRPPGAGRALFRWLRERLRPAPAEDDDGTGVA